MSPQEALNRLIEHREIFREEMLSLMRAIMSGEVSPMLIGAVLIGLRVKKETIGEIAAAADAFPSQITYYFRTKDGLSEAVFREVNERIKGLANLFKWREPERLDLVCECRNATCCERIEMTRAEYEAVRAVDTQFALYPGHAEPEIERVISSHKGYEVVAKQGDAAAVARTISTR